MRLVVRRQHPGLIAGEQQGRPIAGRRQQGGQVVEHFADPQFGIGQAQGSQAGGVERMVGFTAVLQQDDAGAAVECRNQWAEAMVERALAALAAGSGHGVLLGRRSLPQTRGRQSGPARLSG